MAIFVNLIRGNIENASSRLCPPDTFQQVYRPHHIGGVGAHRVTVPLPDNGLGGHVKHNFRPRLVSGVPKSI